MITEIIMPKNGMDMLEGVLVRWLKNEGDVVEYEEPIFVVETDKITMESEAPAKGILLKKLYEEGATVPVFTVLGYIGEPGDVIPETTQEAVAEKTENTEETQTNNKYSSWNSYQFDYMAKNQPQNTFKEYSPLNYFCDLSLPMRNRFLLICQIFDLFF